MNPFGSGSVVNIRLRIWQERSVSPRLPSTWEFFPPWWNYVTFLSKAAPGAEAGDGCKADYILLPEGACQNDPKHATADRYVTQKYHVQWYTQRKSFLKSWNPIVGRSRNWGFQILQNAKFHEIIHRFCSIPRNSFCQISQKSWRMTMSTKLFFTFAKFRKTVLPNFAMTSFEKFRTWNARGRLPERSEACHGWQVLDTEVSYRIHPKGEFSEELKSNSREATKLGFSNFAKCKIPWNYSSLSLHSTKHFCQILQNFAKTNFAKFRTSNAEGSLSEQS